MSEGRVHLQATCPNNLQAAGLKAGQANSPPANGEPNPAITIRTPQPFCLHMPRHLFATLRDTLLFGIVLLWLGAAANAQVGHLLGKPTYKSDQVTAQLLVHAPQGVVAGQTLWAGLQLQHAAKWHTYWLNSGDWGLPTQLTWQLPPGITAGDIAWPTPKKFPIGHAGQLRVLTARCC